MKLTSILLISSVFLLTSCGKNLTSEATIISAEVAVSKPVLIIIGE
jgi:hypothetical protein